MHKTNKASHPDSEMSENKSVETGNSDALAQKCIIQDFALKKLQFS